MSKEEFLKIQTCILKVNIHCEGCKGKVKKILQKIEGVYKINIDSEQGKVTVSGNVEPETLIKKLGKSGKHAELWGPPQKQNQNQQQQQLNNQLKNLQIDNNNNNGKGGNNKGQKGKSDNQQQPKTGGAGKQGQQNPNQLQQMKALQDLKMAQFKDNPKMPFSKSAAKLNLPEEDDITDDEFEDEFDDDDEEDESEDDDMDVAPHLPLNKMKPMMGNGPMPNKMKSGQMQPQHANMSHANGAKSNNNGGSAKKGVGNGNVPVQVNAGKKVGGGNGNNTPNQGSGGGGGKSGGSPTSGGKSGNGGPLNKNDKNVPAGNVGDNFSNNGIGGVKKGSGGMNDGVQGLLPKASNVFPGMSVGNAGHMGAMPMIGQMGGNPMGQMGGNPMGQMGPMGAVQGLPASAIQAGGASGYFRPESMTGGNPFYQQQQLAAAGMMNQPVNANEGFHPMMYARPPPAVSYMPPPYPYPYPYPYPPPANPYTSSYTDENPSSCSLM